MGAPSIPSNWTDSYAPKVFTPGHGHSLPPLAAAFSRRLSANLMLPVASRFLLKYLLWTLLLPVVIWLCLDQIAVPVAGDFPWNGRKGKKQRRIIGGRKASPLSCARKQEIGLNICIVRLASVYSLGRTQQPDRADHATHVAVKLRDRYYLAGGVGKYVEKSYAHDTSPFRPLRWQCSPQWEHFSQTQLDTP